MSGRVFIGRVGLDIDLPQLQTLADTGGSLSIGASNLALGADEGRALIQQISGLVDNPDEPIVPYVNTVNPSHNGWYRVTGVSVTAESLFITDGHLSFAIKLDRAADQSGYSEIVTFGFERQTAISLVTTSPRFWSSFPSSWQGWSSSTGDPTAVSETNETSGGYDITTELGESVTMYIVEDDSLADAIVRTGIPVEAYYDGAPFIKSGGFNLHGRRALIDPEDWAIDNGIVTVGPPVTPGNLLSIQFEGGTVYDIELGTITAGPVWNVMDLPTPRSVTALRLGPEIAATRIAWADIDDAATPPNLTNIYLDVMLRRGAAGVNTRFKAELDDANWGMGWLPAGTFTDFDTAADPVGVFETAADANNAQRLLISALGCTRYSVGRMVQTSAASRLDMFIGFAHGLTVDTDADSPQFACDMYFANLGETQRMVKQ